MPCRKGWPKVRGLSKSAKLSSALPSCSSWSCCLGLRASCLHNTCNYDVRTMCLALPHEKDTEWRWGS